MHTGITIEQLIATVVRVDAKIEKTQKIFAGLSQVRVMPFREATNLVARPGVS